MTTENTIQELKHYGIYKITNTITNDYYIGSTTESFQKRKAKHKYDFKNFKEYDKRAACPILYKAFLKYDFENFKFEILKAFKMKKDPKRTKEIITYIEEKYIQKDQPYYNICKQPTRGGCPNLGKKLSQAWKDKIGEKSKLFKHIGEKMNIQNKKGASKYNVCTTNECFIGSLVECAQYFKVDVGTILNRLHNKYNSSNILSVEKLKSQKKSIILYVEDQELFFDSYSKCDKYLNLWRGFTSTQIINNRKLILNYKYKLINEDIV